MNWRDKYLHMVWWGVAGDLGRKVDTPSFAEGFRFGLNKEINYRAIYAAGTGKNVEISGSVVAVKRVGPDFLMH
jgi:hypothetical protein